MGGAVYSWYPAPTVPPSITSYYREEHVGKYIADAAETPLL